TRRIPRRAESVATRGRRDVNESLQQNGSDRSSKENFKYHNEAPHTSGCSSIVVNEDGPQRREPFLTTLVSEKLLQGSSPPRECPASYDDGGQSVNTQRGDGATRKQPNARTQAGGVGRNHQAEDGRQAGDRPFAQAIYLVILLPEPFIMRLDQ